MTLAAKVVWVLKKSLTPFLSQWKVLGEGVSDRNIKVFLIFFCFHLDSSVFTICYYIVRSKHPRVQTFHWLSNVFFFFGGGGLFPNHLSGEHHVVISCYFFKEVVEIFCFILRKQTNWKWLNHKSFLHHFGCQGL